MGKTKLEISQTVEGEWTRLLLRGPLDEDAKALFKALEPTLGKRILLDMAGVTHLNSVGIRDWTLFLKDFSSDRDVAFDRCPDEVVRTMSMVTSFRGGLPVRSLLRGYQCDHCDHEQTELFLEGKDFKRGELPQPLEKVCAACGSLTAPFDSDEEFFQFLLGR